MGLGTVVLVTESTECDDEYTVTMRAFELGFAMGRHEKRFTVRQIAEEFAMSLSGAYRLLSRASGSRKVAVIEIDGAWYVPADEAEWPY